MKTHTVQLLTLILSAALPVSARAGSHHGNHSSEAASAPGGGQASRSAAAAHFSGGRMISPSQRFYSNGIRSMPGGVRQNYVRSNGGSRANHAGSIRNGNRALPGAGNHVVAQRPANWQRNWDRRHDHSWHGHRCRFINGSWFIFDFGFIPWYGYPYAYYPDPYYYYGDPYYYDPGADQDAGQSYDDKGSYNSSDQGDSSVAGAQERLARQGYYQGNIDGVFGPATRRAVMRYQRAHGLRVTGYLTADTLQALGLRRASNY